jgi:DNA-binding SARP family transcriptional activator/WD40 repeat protein
MFQSGFNARNRVAAQHGFRETELEATVGTCLAFGILGPLEVRRDGVELPVGGPRQRALLAMLLCHANEVVSRDVLIDELIRDEASDAPDRVLRVQVSRLRKSLANGDEDATRLVARAPGYVLRLAPDELDLHTFERLVHEGHEALARQDWRRASALLGEADGLWRGRALADLDGAPFARVEAQRLSDLRLLAIEDRIEADLALGDHVALCGELPALVDEHPLRERLRFQLMLALYRAGRQSDALALYRQTHRLLRDELGLAPSRRLRELERAILAQAESLGSQVEAPVARLIRGPDVCPFKGLNHFERTDATTFFGRERVVAELVARAADGGIVGIVGSSGVGKSSVLRAGVLAALAADALPGSSAWRQVVIRPGEHPGAHLRAVLGGTLRSILSGLEEEHRLVLCVDQLEELFTTCESASERDGFLADLWEAALEHRRRVLIVVALRGDFYTHAACHPGFAELLSHNHLLLGQLDRDELASAIVRPASRLGLTVEPALVEALVADAATQSGGLPLLSAMLVQLWEARDSDTLVYRHYRASGGIEAAVARLAEAVYDTLNDRGRAAAREVMVRLAADRDGVLIRRRARRDELERVDGGSDVLAALVSARLLTAGEDRIELAHEALLCDWPRYSAWLEADRAGRRLHAHLAAAALEWDARGQDPSELYRGARLGAALEWAAEHDERVDPLERAFLQRSRAMGERDQRRQRRQNQRLRALLVAVAVLLVVAVVAAALARSGQDSARAQARAALARQLGAEAVGEPRLDLAMLMARGAVILDRSTQTEASLLATLLRYPGVIATIGLPQPATRITLAPDGRTLAISDASGELRFIDARTHAARLPPVGQVLADQAPAYSPDGTLIAYRSSACRCGFIEVRSTRTDQLVAGLSAPSSMPSQVDAIPGRSVLVSPDDRTVLYAYWTTGSRRAYVQRWALPSGRPEGTMAIGSGPLLAVSLIDGGTRLAVLSRHSVAVYDTSAPRRPQILPLADAVPAGSLGALAPGGQIAAVATPSGSVSFIDAATGRLRASSRDGADPVAATAFANNGRVLVTVTRTGSVTPWSVPSGRALPTLAGPPSEVQDAALSPDGRTLYTASPGLILQWDLGGQRRFARSTRLSSPAGTGDDLSPPGPAFVLSPDGTRFAVRLGKRTVGIFSTASQRRLATFSVALAAQAITALAWSPRGDAIAAAGGSGFVELWSARGHQRRLLGLAPQLGQPEEVQALAFSPDGSLLAAGDANQTAPAHLGAGPGRTADLAVWRVATGARVAGAAELSAGDEPAVAPMGDVALAFSRDGRHLAMSRFDGSIAILDPRTGTLQQALDNPEGATALAFASDRTLVAGTPAGTVERFDIVTGTQVGAPLAAADGAVTGLALDPAETLLATSGRGAGGVKLWFGAAGAQSSEILTTQSGSTAVVAFSHDGRTLLAADDRGNAYTWPASPAAWEDWACRVAGRAITRAEWTGLVAGVPYSPVCVNAAR